MIMTILKGLMKVVVSEIKKIAISALIFVVIGSITLSITEGTNAIAQLFLLVGEYAGISKIVDIMSNKK